MIIPARKSVALSIDAPEFPFGVSLQRISGPTETPIIPGRIVRGQTSRRGPLEVVVFLLFQARGLEGDAEVTRTGTGKDCAAAFRRQRFRPDNAGGIAREIFDENW